MRPCEKFLKFYNQITGRIAAKPKLTRKDSKTAIHKNQRNFEYPMIIILG